MGHDQTKCERALRRVAARRNARVRGLPVSEWGKFYITKGIDNNVEYIDMDGYAV